LVKLVVGMVRHFLQIADGPNEQEEQRLRLMVTSQLDDGEFARLLFLKITELIGEKFIASLERAMAADDAVRITDAPLDLFWFAHHTVVMAALARFPATRCLTYGNDAKLDRQLCHFILRGIGLTDAAIATHLDRELSQHPAQPVPTESA
jgi:hypothetical protein